MINSDRAQSGELKDIINADGMPKNQADVPFLDRRIAVENNQSVVVEHDFDLTRNCYLQDYLVGGQYIQPGAMACEMLVEAASLVQPGREVLGLADIKLHHALKVWPGKHIKVTMRADLIEREGDISRVRVRILSNLTVPNGTELVKERLLYEGTILLGDRRSQPAPPRVDVPERPNQPTVDFARYYDFPGNYALLGPRFQTVKTVRMLSGKRILGDLRMQPEGDLFSFTASPGLRIAPTLLDGYLQVTSTLGTLFSGQFCSPRGFRKIDVYRVPVPGEEVQVLTELVGEDEQHLYFDFAVINSRREACLVVHGYRTLCLNVLAPELLEMCKHSFGLEHLPTAGRDISERVAG